MDNLAQSHFSPLAVLGALAAVLLGTVSCAPIDGPDEPAVVVVPSAATSTPQYNGNGAIPPQRYVVRMSDGSRDWEVEFPEVARGYEVRIPLDDDDSRSADVRNDHQSLTRADRELLEHLRRNDPDYERSGIYADGENILDRQENGDSDDDDRDGGDEDRPAPSRPSYLRGLEQVQRLFDARQYEAAMIQLVNLEEAYPNDVRIKSMKGTLWLRLGRESLARDAWEQVLQIDPDNEPVQEALRRLDADGGDTTDGQDSIDEQDAIDELED